MAYQYYKALKWHKKKNAVRLGLSTLCPLQDLEVLVGPVSMRVLSGERNDTVSWEEGDMCLVPSQGLDGLKGCPILKQGVRGGTE